MLNAILNGALGETSSRSGSSTSSRSGSSTSSRSGSSSSSSSGTSKLVSLQLPNHTTALSKLKELVAERDRSSSGTSELVTLQLPNHTTVQVPQAEADALKQLMVIYDLASEYAGGKNLPQPKWDDVVKYGSVVKEWYKQGKAFDAQSYEQSQLSVQPVGQHYITPIYNECMEYAQANNFPLPSFQWVQSFGATALTKLKELVAERDRTGINIPDPYAPNVVIPDAVMVSVAPSEEKVSSLLVPGIILALGVIGAIALTSKSKKRR